MKWGSGGANTGPHGAQVSSMPGRGSRRSAASAAGAPGGNPGDNGAMDIQLNGEPLRLADAGTVQALLEAQGLAERRVAVEVNGEIVPRSRHATHVLQPGDRIEIVHALGGG